MAQSLPWLEMIKSTFQVHRLKLPVEVRSRSRRRIERLVLIYPSTSYRNLMILPSFRAVPNAPHRPLQRATLLRCADYRRTCVLRLAFERTLLPLSPVFILRSGLVPSTGLLWLNIRLLVCLQLGLASAGDHRWFLIRRLLVYVHRHVIL